MTPSRRSRSWRSIVWRVLLDGAPLDRRDVPLRPGASALVEPRAADHEVADDPHQIVEPRQIDAHDVRRLKRAGVVARRPAILGRRRPRRVTARVRFDADAVALATSRRVAVVEVGGDEELERDALRHDSRRWRRMMVAAPRAAGPGQLSTLMPRASSAASGANVTRHDGRDGAAASSARDRRAGRDSARH